MSRRRYIGLYTVLFAFTALGSFFVFLYRGRSLVWETDGGSQYLPYLAYMGSYLREFVRNLLQGHPTHLMYDFTIGMGDDIGNVIRAHPLDYLSIFVPVRYTEYLYDALIILRMYLAGLSFSAFGLYFAFSPVPVMAGSFVYVFCGHVMHLGIMHPTFLSALIILPLLLLGAEKMLRREGFVLFAAMTFLGFMSNYYFMYMCTIAMAVYVILRYTELYKGKKIRHFLKTLAPMIGTYIIGTGMACFTLLPTGMSLGSAARFNVDSGSENLLYYSDTERYYRWFLDLIFPHRGTGYNTYLNYAVLVLPAFALLFFACKKQFRALKIGLVIGTAVMLIPFGGYAMAGFSNVTNRWIFIYSFMAALAVTVTIPKMAKLSRKEWHLLLGMAVLYLLLVLLDIWYVKSRSSLLGMPLLAAALAGMYLTGRLHTGEKKKQTLLLGIILVSVIINGFAGYSYYGKGFSKQFLESGTGISRIMNSVRKRLVIEDDDGFYRCDTSMATVGKENYSLLLGYQSTYMYNSLLNGPLMTMLVEQENTGADASIRMHGFDGRFVSESLANVRYYLTKRSTPQNVPYGFELREDLSSKNYTVYENTLPLSFGYTYDTVISRETYEALNAAEKEQIMLYCAVVENLPEDADESLSEGAEETAQKVTDSLLYEAIHLPEETENITRTENGYKVNKKKAKLKFEIEQKAGYECYLELQDFYCSKKKRTVTVRSEDQKTILILRGLGSAYSLGRRSYLVRLGSFEEDKTDTVTLSFNKKGTYELSGLRMIYVPVGGYAEAIAALNAEAMTDTQISGNRITGRANLSSSRLMVFSIPRRKGWKLKVDGATTKLLTVNTAYMGVVLPAGEHEIELIYETPGMRIGGMIAACSWLLLILLTVKQKKKRRA